MNNSENISTQVPTPSVPTSVPTPVNLNKSVSHLDKQNNIRFTKIRCAQKKTCKLMKNYVLQYY